MSAASLRAGLVDDRLGGVPGYLRALIRPDEPASPAPLSAALAIEPAPPEWTAPIPPEEQVAIAAVAPAPPAPVSTPELAPAPPLPQARRAGRVTPEHVAALETFLPTAAALQLARRTPGLAITRECRLALEALEVLRELVTPIGLEEAHA